MVIDQERLDAYIEKVVSEAPPLTDEQRDRIATILRPFADGSGHAHRRVGYYEDVLNAELEKAREAERKRETSLKEAQRLAATLLVCDVCNVPPEGHWVQTHEWVPGRAERILGSKERAA